MTKEEDAETAILRQFHEAMASEIEPQHPKRQLQELAETQLFALQTAIKVGERFQADLVGEVHLEGARAEIHIPICPVCDKDLPAFFISQSPLGFEIPCYYCNETVTVDESVDWCEG